MSDGRVLFFTVSGQRFTNRSRLYQRLEFLLPEKFRNRKFEFLGNPIHHLHFPLLWDEKEKRKHATTRLIACWEHLNEFCCKKLRPALRNQSVILTDGFGLDALLYSTALSGCPQENAEAFRLHSGFVSLRLLEQQVPAPEYFITRANPGTAQKEMLKRIPKLTELGEETRLGFIDYEERTIERYFRDIKHQKAPHYIDASLSVDAMAERICDRIGAHLAHAEAA